MNQIIRQFDGKMKKIVKQLGELQIDAAAAAMMAFSEKLEQKAKEGEKKDEQ